jgi:ubiquinone/menaquinone biosynthesis C-methylase UbiE
MQSDKMSFNEEPRRIIEFYERLGSNLDIARERLDAGWKVRSLLEVIPNDKFNSVLEVGSGSALVLKGISDAVCADKKISCDLSISMLYAAKIEMPEAILVRASADHLPFRDSSIELVILCDILEHVEDVPLLLAETRRIAKNIAFKIPLERCLMIKLQEIIGRKKLYGFGHHCSGHLYVWNKREALSILERAGLAPWSYRLVEPPEEIRHYGKSEKSEKLSIKNRIVNWIEKNTYNKMRSMYRFLYGSTLVAFVEVEKDWYL